MRKVFSILFCFVFFFSTLYFLWTTTPLFAFQEAIFALKDHDRETFEKRLDVDGFVRGLVDDLLVKPAYSTPGLTGFQTEVLRGAVAVTAEGLYRELRGGIYRSLSISYLFPLDFSPLDLFSLPAYAAGGDDLKTLLNVAGHAANDSLRRMKMVAQDRMIYYLRSHPQTLAGRLLACPPDQRSQVLAALLGELGLTVKDFKGLDGCSIHSTGNDNEEAVVSFRFYSPKVGRDFLVKILLKKHGWEPWQIARIDNVSEVFSQLELDYEGEIHALMRFSLDGMNQRGVDEEMTSVKDELRRNQGTKAILDRLKIKL
ncbi:MAG: hypothetical protein K2Y32_19460 [Candidatus Obscuribacterales bacterium]|nr:hypothetical protein [Candidatus Obscuribacterales bacterium]